METIQTSYLGELRTEATHLQSGKVIITDAPTDNHGKGQAFSPTDLLSAALGSCMLTIMGIRASKLGISIDGTKVKVTKIMADSPRRVAEVVVEFDIPQTFAVKHREILEDAAVNCPVAKSLNSELKQTVRFTYSR